MRGHALRSPGSFGSIPSSTKPYENAVHFRSSGTATPRVRICDASSRARLTACPRDPDMQTPAPQFSGILLSRRTAQANKLAHAEFTSALLACIPVVSSSLHFAPQANSDN